MSNILHQTLGLGNVDADVNNLPDGRYDGKVKSSQYVYVDSKDTLSHVISYEVTEGEYKGRNKDEWFMLAREPRKADGSAPDKGKVDISEIATLTPAMSDNAKPWYKKRHLDLGVPEQAFDAGINIATLEGRPVTFGVKRKDGYVNINFVESREVDTTNGPVALNTGESVTGSNASAPASLDF